MAMKDSHQEVLVQDAVARNIRALGANLTSEPCLLDGRRPRGRFRQAKSFCAVSLQGATSSLFESTSLCVF